MNVCIKQIVHWFYHKTIGKYQYVRRCETSNCLIIPCDLEYVGGSRGDEAMILATIEYLGKCKTSSTIYIGVFNKSGLDYVENLKLPNVRPLVLEGCAYNIHKTYKQIVEFAPSIVAILGADCMDGFYSLYTSLYLLIVHDLLSSNHICKSRLLGFSFNEHSSSIVDRCFRLCSKQTPFSVRDSISLRRFISKTGVKARLTADTAFLLSPQQNFTGYNLLKEWAFERKKENRKIVGFNFHPMLRKYKNKEDLRGDSDAVARNIYKILCERDDLAFVLIPHDNRNLISDVIMLDYIYDFLSTTEYKHRVYYDRSVYHANQIKSLTGLLDAMVTSRMHLAIGCLGMKTPIMAATYQGKFEGLFLHFNLSQKLLLDATDLVSDVFIERFFYFIDNLNTENASIIKALPKVIELSKKNFI